MTEYIYDWTPNKQHAKEEIVRCKDCTYRRKSWNGKRPDFIPDGFFCAYWGGHELWEPNGFCAWGWRKVER